MDGVRRRALLGLFTHLVKDKCFDQLRTKEQLGYLVWSGGSVHGGYVYNARFVVQSKPRSPEYLDQRVEAFLEGFREVHVLRRIYICVHEATASLPMMW